MSARALRPLSLAALLLGAWLASHALAPDLDVVWLSLAPVFALLLALVAGRYVGEDALGRLAARRARPEHRRARRDPAAPRRHPARAQGRGLLLARRLAGRAPPCAAPYATP